MSDEKKPTLMDNLLKLPFFKKLKNIKHIEIIICIIFISLLLLIYFYGGVKTKTNKSESTSKLTVETLSYTTTDEYAKLLEDKLENIIGSLKGVGNISVMVNLKSGSELVVATSTEEENVYSSNGDKINQTIIKTPIMVEENGTSKPVILMELAPEIEGVIVVAGGADDVNVKLNIYKLLQAILSISSDKIQVFAGK
ncbi:MAG: hypothetical protein ACI4T1_03975 [Christensenellales bacterium]